MTKQALAEIVEIEKEIQTRLAEERRKAADWLDGEKNRIVSEVEEKLASARQDFRQAIAEAEADASSEVTAMLEEAEAYSARLEALPDERLRDMLLAALTSILPGDGS